MNAARVIAALTAASLRGLVRDRVSFWSMIVTACLAGASPHLLSDWLAALQRQVAGVDEEELESDRDPCQPPCSPEVLGAVAFEGEAPPRWLRWSQRSPSVAEASVLIVVTGGAPVRFDVLSLERRGRLGQKVVECLGSKVRRERKRRLTEVGLDEQRLPVARVLLDPRTPPPPFELPAPSWPGAALVLVLVVLLLSVHADLGPTARVSGALEALMSTPVRAGDVVVSWWVIGCIHGLGATALFLLGHLAGAAVSGDWGLGFSLWLVPAAVVAVSAVFVFVFVEVEDLRTVLIKGVPVVLLAPASLLVFFLIESRWPSLGWLVPGGGLLAAMIGWVPTTAGQLASAATSSLLAGACLLGAGRALGRLDITMGALGRRTARRAVGNYRPEALLLFLIGVAGTISLLPMQLHRISPLTGLLLIQPVFYLLPALLVSRPLRLDQRSLLSLRRPSGRALVLAPLVAAGGLALGVILALGTRGWFDQTVMRRFAQMLEGAELSTPLSIAVLSLLPAVCEEVLFRGAILGLLRKGMPAWAAVVVQALLFGALHGLAFRILPTAALGMVLGMVVVRTGSILPAMMVHALNNVTALTLADAAAADVPDQVDPWTWAVLGGVAALGLAAAWLMGQRRERG